MKFMLQKRVNIKHPSDMKFFTNLVQFVSFFKGYFAVG